MRLFLVFSVAAVCSAPPAIAQQRQFPYEAVVQTRDAVVRSGPGRKYYATSQLAAGRRVMVHRHDPGGWYMIAPPSGSFSWVDVRKIRRESPSQGVVADTNTLAWVGTTVGETHTVWQVRLSRGDTVRLLGDTFGAGGGPSHLIKIAPPRGEYRWVRGEDVAPADQLIRQKSDRDPYKIPSHARRGAVQVNYEDHPHGLSVENVSRPATTRRGQKGFSSHPQRSGTGTAVRRSGPTREQLDTERARLARLDASFRETIEQDASLWDLDCLEADYRRFHTETQHSALKGRAGLRLAAIERYRRIKAAYDVLHQITAETTHRERHLAALQHRQSMKFAPAMTATQPAAVTAAPENTQIVIQQAPQFSSVRQAPRISHNPDVSHTPPVPQIQAVPQAHGNPVLTIPRRQTIVAAPRQTNVRAVPLKELRRLDGAGKIQRAISHLPGAPRYVLTAPNGRILAWLRAGHGVHLDRFVGREMGVYGLRSRSQDLKADLIVVRELEPVRLIR